MLAFLAALDIGSQIGSSISIALTILSVASIAGIGLQRGRVVNARELLREEREDHDRTRLRLNNAEVDHAKEMADAKAELSAKDAEISSLGTEIVALQRVVTGEAHLVAIGDRIEDAIVILKAIRAEQRRTKAGEDDGQP